MSAREQRPGLNSPEDARDDVPRQVGCTGVLKARLRRAVDAFPPRSVRILVTGALDVFTRKDPWTVSFVCKRRFGYSGNIRVACEALAADRRYNVQLWCETALSPATKRGLNEQGVRLLTWGSVGALRSLVSSGVLVVDHSIRDAYIVRARSDRAIVNLWHGVPIKRIELGIQQLAPARERMMRTTASLYDALIANSADDQQAIAQAFGVDRSRVRVTGLPRLDMLTGHHPLASDLEQDRHRLRERLGGRKLVLYAPTFREVGPSPFSQLTQSEWEALDATVQACGAVLGLRAHPYDPTPHPRGLAGIISISAAQYPETNLVLRDTRVLITDFSSLWVDYLALDRPIVGFAKDRGSYASRERGFLYEFDEVFPTQFIETVDELTRRLRELLGSGAGAPDYSKQRAVFYGSNPPPYTSNCVELIRALSRGNQHG